ncbi:MAG: hypothetical protein SF028_12930 [Candidatus Sumerlaeia bacterium]|nr:hypothetical protein [Candidatus Sumerlaeia bacterium]
MKRDDRVRLGIALVLAGLLALGASIGIGSRQGLKQWRAELLEPVVLPDAYHRRFPDGIAVGGERIEWFRSKMRGPKGDENYLHGEGGGLVLSLFEEPGEPGVASGYNPTGAFIYNAQLPEFRLLVTAAPSRAWEVAALLGPVVEAAAATSETLSD